MSLLYTRLWVVVLLAMGLLSAASVQADCNCQNGGSGLDGSYPAATGSIMGFSPSYRPGEISFDSPGPMIMDVGSSVASGIAPPPGTLGRTYQLPSRPVPTKKHPRTGMVDVRVVGASNVIVHDINPMRTEDTLDGFRDVNDANVWHFASEPLYPGLPHIYRVEATFDGPNGPTTQERQVRLIRGRIVTLEF